MAPSASALALSASLSVLCDVRKHVHVWESTADDRGTDERTLKHFLQRAANTYQAAVRDTQATSLLMGHPASMSTVQ